MVNKWVWHESLGASTNSGKQKRNALIYVAVRIRSKCWWYTTKCRRHNILKTWSSPNFIKLCLKIHCMYNYGRMMQRLL